MMYKIGLVYKRQEIFRSELMEEIHNAENKSSGKFKQEVANLTTGLSQLHHDLEEHTEKQRAFRIDIVSVIWITQCKEKQSKTFEEHCKLVRSLLVGISLDSFMPD